MKRFHDIFRIFSAFQIFFSIVLSWGIKRTWFLNKSPNFEFRVPSFKWFFLFEAQISSQAFLFVFQLYENCYNHKVASTLFNIVQLDVENSNVVLTLFKVGNFNIDVKRVVSTLIWRCHINLTTTLERHLLKRFLG